MTTDDRPSGDDKYCGGKKRQGDGYCTRPAGWGTDHPGIGRCKLHGGSTASHTAKAQRITAERIVVTYGLPREVDPHAALLEELHRTAGHVGWLSALISELEHEQSVQATLMGQPNRHDSEDSHVPRSGLKQFSRDKSTTWEKPSVWVEMYQWERKHLREIAKACIDAGIAERQVQLAEQQGKQLAQVIGQIVAGLGKIYGFEMTDEPVEGVVRPALQLVRAA